MPINCKKKSIKNNLTGSLSELGSELESNKDSVIYFFIALSCTIHLDPSKSN